MITNDTRIEIMRQAGRTNALALQGEAPTMDGTAIIARERDVPDFDPNKDYTGWPVGAPVADDGQVWQLIQPHNAKDYGGRPATLRALWGLCHTKDPARAKPWVDPYGMSGMYMVDECYRSADGKIYRCKADNTIHDAAALPTAWEEVAI